MNPRMRTGRDAASLANRLRHGHRRMSRLLCAATFAAAFGSAGAAHAGSSEVSLGELGPGSFFITGDGFVMAPTEQWYTPTPSQGHHYQNAYIFNQDVVRLGVGYHFNNGVTAYVQGIGTGLFNLPTNATAPYPQGESGLGATYYAANHVVNGVGVFLKQAYIALDPAKFDGFGFVGGRYEFNDGTEIVPDDPDLRWLVLNRIQQRLIGSRYVLVGGRSFDGAKVSYGDANRNVTFLYGIPTEGAYLLNGNNEIGGINLAYLSFNAGPGVLPGPLGQDALARVFAIQYNDTRGLLLPSNQSLAQREANNGAVRITTIGGDYVRQFKAGPGAFDTLLWGAYQLGSWGALAQRAYSYSVEAGYHWTSLPWRPWLRAGYTVGSGDRNANNSTHGTFFQVLPTPWYFANFAFYDMQNIDDAMVELMTFPSSTLQWRLDAHALWLNSSNDLWYAGGGAWNDTLFGYQPRPSYGQSYLATVLETFLGWDVNPHLSLNGYVGHSFGGSVVAANYPMGREANFGFLMAMWHL